MKGQNFKTIIIGLDFSKSSRNAYMQGLELSKQMNANLLIVHVFKTPTSPSYLLFEKNKKDLIEKIKDNLIKTYKISKSLHSNVVVKLGIPEIELINLAKKHHSPVIVISASGKNSFSRFMLGSTAERIAISSSAPVWIQKGKPRTKFRNVLIPIDLSSNSNQLLNWSEDFLAHHHLSKTAVFVQTPIVPILDYVTWSQLEEKAEADNKLNFTKLKKKHKNVKFLMLHGDAATELVNLSKTLDLIIIAPRNTSHLFPAFGSVSTKVIRNSRCSELIVPLDKNR